MASFDTLPLPENLITHFTNAPYVWELNPREGMHVGFLNDKKLKYVHMVKVSLEVLKYITEVLYAK